MESLLFPSKTNFSVFSANISNAYFVNSFKILAGIPPMLMNKFLQGFFNEFFLRFFF